jgi:hypothetical protein
MRNFFRRSQATTPRLAEIARHRLLPDQAARVLWLESPPDLALPDAWADENRRRYPNRIWDLSPSPWSSGRTWLLIGIRADETIFLDRLRAVWGRYDEDLWSNL